MREPFGFLVWVLKPVWGWVVAGAIFATPLLWIVAMKMRHSEEYWQTVRDMERAVERAHAEEFAKANAAAKNDREFIRCVLWCVDNATISVSPEQENRDEPDYNEP